MNMTLVISENFHVSASSAFSALITCSMNGIPKDVRLLSFAASLVRKPAEILGKTITKT